MHPSQLDSETSRAVAQPAAGPRSVTVSPRTLWLGAAILLGMAALIYVVVTAKGVLLLLFIAIIIAEGIRPLVVWLRRWRIPRPIAVLLVYLVALIFVSGLGWLLITPLAAQVSALIAATPQYVTETQRLLLRVQIAAGNNPQLAQVINQVTAQMGALIGQIVPLLIQVPVSIASMLFDAVLALALAFFWLTTIDAFKPFVVSLFPDGAQENALSVLDEMGRKVGGYLRGVTFNMVVVGILSGLGDFVLGVPYPLLLGIFAGLTEIIPFIGPFIGGAAATLVALVAVGPFKAGQVVLLYTLIQQIEGNTLVPLVMHRAVELNPFVILVAVLLGGALFGLVGGVLAVPAAAVIQVLVVRVLAPAARRATAQSQRSMSPVLVRERDPTPSPS